MFALETAETTGLKQCQACGAAQIVCDKFCRRCGARQGFAVEPSDCVAGAVACDIVERADRSGCETAPLPGAGTLRRSYSGRLVGIVTQELSVQTSSIRSNRWAMFLIGLLVAAPLWLMIILLSPLDAYVAAKDFAKQV